MSGKILATNAISTFITDRFKMDTLTGMMVASSLVEYVLTFKEDNMKNFKFNEKYLLFLIPIVLPVIYYFYKKYNKEIINKEKYLSLKSYSHFTNNKILQYIRNFPEYFDKFDTEYGDVRFPQTEDLFFPVDFSCINFNDKNFNVKGYIETYSFEDEVESKKKYYRYLTIHIEKSCSLTPEEYFDKIKQKNREIVSKDPRITLYGIKVMSSSDREFLSNKVSVIYEGLKKNEDERLNLIKSFFSPCREKVWNMVKRVHFNPEKFFRRGQIPSCCLMLYGPPGTGKSSFGNKLAIALSRDLIVLDMRDFVNNKPKLYQILSAPSYNEDVHEAKDVVIMLEEFDVTIKYLIENNKTVNWANFYPTIAPQIANNDIKSETKSNKNDDGRTNIGESHKLTLNDLLELFQGPIGRPGSIIIATTNHYDFIKESLPALVREGRMTPIKIDYLDWKSFKELVRFYFNKETTLEEVKIKCPTSAIIQIAMRYEDDENGLDFFEQDFIIRNKQNDK
jgi:hypothetical protein